MNKILVSLVAAGAALAFQTSHAATGEELYQTKGCVACHAIDAPRVGPSYQSVAEKHGSEADAAATLANHIKNGSSGVWGVIPMPPNNVTEEEATVLAEWVLTQKQ